MGWWKVDGGEGVIGDPPADYIDRLTELGLSWNEPSELPSEIRERLCGFWIEEWGREATENELRSLLRFCGGQGGGPLSHLKG